MLFRVNFAWPRALAWARVALASVALVFTYLFLRGGSLPLFYGYSPALTGADQHKWLAF